MGDRLRAVWDPDDLDSTEKRLLTLLTLEASRSGRAEVMSQLARIHGLRADFAEADRMLDDAHAECGPDAAAHARIDLERARLRRSDGTPAQALACAESAFQGALAAGAEFIAVDAAYLASLVADDRAGRIEWTRRGMDLAQRSADPQLAAWIAPLLTNLGWEYFESGHYEPALDAFERALQHRERDPGNRAEAEITRYAVARTLRALGQAEEAAIMLEQVAAWAVASGHPDGWYHEELAEVYATLGRFTEARDQARRAIPLLSTADPAFKDDSPRAERLRELAR
jgi:tetratricopeptide (TPR) repeat protein